MSYNELLEMLLDDGMDETTARACAAAELGTEGTKC